MLHSHASLHFPLIRQLELLLHSSGASLNPVQCSALCTFMLFMNPYQILPSGDQVVHHVDGPLGFEMGITSPIDEKNVDERSKLKENQIGNCHVKVLFEWRWESCFKAQKDGHRSSEMQVEALELESMGGEFTGSAEAGSNNHWMEQFCDAFRMDSETNILWATRFAASYLRNVAVYWEHILFNKDCSETWLLTDSARQLKHITLVGPIFGLYTSSNFAN